MAEPGPADGTNATTITPGRRNLKWMLRAAEEYSMNLGFLAKGNTSNDASLADQIEAVRLALKSTKTGEQLLLQSIIVRCCRQIRCASRYPHRHFE